jgi:tetratricopeptide (TPR) repeat protein
MRIVTLLSLFAAVGLLALSLAIPPAKAHVEGHMPDSVAEMEYRIVLEFKPKDFATRVKLAMVLMNQDKQAEAEKEFEKALKTDPRNLQAHLGLSLLRLKRNRIGEALLMIEKAAKIAPDSAAVCLNYGKILEADNRPGQAAKMYNKGLGQLAADSDNPDAEHDRQQLETALRNLAEKLHKILPAN